MYKILTECGVPMKLVRLIKMCFSKVLKGKYLSGNFAVQNGLKQGDNLTSLRYNVFTFWSMLMM
jgi:hypothetical protein